jgi:hypothetical protein
MPCKKGKAEEAVCFTNNFERHKTGFPVVVPIDKRKPDELGRYFKGSTGVLCESKGL